MWRRLILSIVGGVVLIVPALRANAQEALDSQAVVVPAVLITELQTNGLSAEEEFIEIYNPTSGTMDLAQFKLERATATASSEASWTTLTMINALSGELSAYGYLIIGHKDYTSLATDFRFGGTNLPNTGGHLRIVWDDPATEITERIETDRLGWGTSAMPEGSSALAAEAGQSIQRCILETEEYQDTDDNSADFKVFEEPNPGSASADCSVTETQPGEPDEDEQTEEETEVDDTEQEVELEEEAVLELPIQITELLPNPASPQTDANDEFVELYNPNTTEAKLDGWKLETGNSFSYRVFLDNMTIPAGGYLVITSGKSNLTLSNSGGSARLINKGGELVAQTDSYDDADDGASWAQVGGVWQWTITPTAGITNILTPIPAPAVKAAKTTTKKVAKKAAAKKVTSKTSAKPNKAAAVRDIFEAPPSDGQLLPVNPAVLAAVGVAALGYSLYEYRHDVRNKLEQFRRHRAIRRASRAKA